MFYRNICCPALLMLAMVAVPVRAQNLSLGDPAPELKISEWVKGEPVQIKKGKGKHVYFIEFWATWCPPCVESIPHLTEMQKKYRNQGLVVIGVASPGKGETLRTVKRFVKRKGDTIGYTVAYDGSTESTDRYMRAVGASGIPWAFLVDREGTIVWYGHPGNPIVGEIIDQVIKGTYDASEAMLAEKLAPLFGRLNRFHLTRDWAAFTSTAKTILGIDPKNETAFGALIYVYLAEQDDVDGFRAFVQKHIDTYREDARVMNGLAQALLSITELDKRQPDLALGAALAAYSACKRSQECVGADTYAMALFQIGLLDKAIEFQAEAVSNAKGPDQRSAFERIAEYYRACKSLQSSGLKGS